MTISWLSDGAEPMRITMVCSFEKLIKLLDKQMSLNARLEVYDHLDHCHICRDAVFGISRDRDQDFFIFPARRRRRSGGIKFTREFHARIASTPSSQIRQIPA